MPGDGGGAGAGGRFPRPAGAHAVQLSRSPAAEVRVISQREGGAPGGTGQEGRRSVRAVRLRRLVGTFRLERAGRARVASGPPRWRGCVAASACVAYAIGNVSP